jgi:hypothetical protein
MELLPAAAVCERVLVCKRYCFTVEQEQGHVIQGRVPGASDHDVISAGFSTWLCTEGRTVEAREIKPVSVQK